MTQKHDPEDVIKWPDDTWCYRSELPEFGHKSDDYEVLYWGTDERYDFLYRAWPCT